MGLSCLAAISDWRLPAWIKRTLLSVVLTGFLMLSNDKLVRYTWVGTMLAGPRGDHDIEGT